jgi:lysophospholipase L1-like esterase
MKRREVAAVCAAGLVLAGLLSMVANAPLLAQETENRFEKEIRAFEKEDAKNPPPKNAIVFVGSSGIRLWKTLAQDFPNHRVINRGFGGSHISDSTYFADRILIPYKPKMIILRAGTNDIQAGKSPERVAADLKAFMEKVRGALPETRLVFLSLNPSPSRWANIEKERRANELIQAYIATQPNMEFIDISTSMLGPDGLPRPELYIADRLHPSAEGYKLWTSIVAPHLLTE